jgi:hypothetical protein
MTRRVALVAVLLAAAVAALRAGGTYPHAPHPAAAGFSGSALVIVLGAAEGVAFIAFVTVLALVRPQRRPEKPGEPPRIRLPWWVRTLGVLASAFAVAAPLAILLARKARHGLTAPFPVHPGSPGVGPGQAAGGNTAGGWALIAGMALAIAVVVTLSRRPRRARQSRGTQKTREALAAARLALETGRTPREAIIACYAAMERGFAAAGSAAAPAAADTPAEVLTRATRAGILRSGSAEVLTGLFRRARYSDEPMTGADSAAAAGALAQMQAELQ